MIKKNVLYALGNESKIVSSFVFCMYEIDPSCNLVVTQLSTLNFTFAVQCNDYIISHYNIMHSNNHSVRPYGPLTAPIINAATTIGPPALFSFLIYFFRRKKIPRLFSAVDFALKNIRVFVLFRRHGGVRRPNRFHQRTDRGAYVPCGCATTTTRLSRHG